MTQEVVDLSSDDDGRVAVAALEEELDSVERQIEELRVTRDILRSKLARLRSKLGSSPSPTSSSVWADTGFSWDSSLRDAAWRYFGVKQFRDHQLSILNAILSGSDAVLVSPTGSGKSLVYQLPAVLMGEKRLTVVVSPLISLMHDQVSSLLAVGVAARLLSAQEPRQRQTAIRKELKEKHVDVPQIFVTPERIAKSAQFMNLLGRLHEAKSIGLIAVDESHCISQWGHDFRQDYLKLGMLRKHFPGVPIVATTATATPQVVEDICGRLDLDRSRTNVKRAPCDRPNIFYGVLYKPRDKAKAVEQLLATVTKLCASCSPADSNGIVYCLSRKETEDVCASLNHAGIPAVWYHGELGTDSRAAVHKSWMSGESKVIVATVAFGMGVHHDSVRWVIHFSVPPSIQHYQQESGRCGRDGRPAISILMASPFDICRQSVMVYWKPNALQELYVMADLLKSSHLRETFDATAYSVNSYIEKRRTSSPRSIWEFTHREIESSMSRVFDSPTPQVELNVNEEKLRIVERKLNHGRLEIAATVDKDMPPQKILSDQEIQELRKYDGRPMCPKSSLSQCQNLPPPYKAFDESSLRPCRRAGSLGASNTNDRAEVTRGQKLHISWMGNGHTNSVSDGTCIVFKMAPYSSDPSWEDFTPLEDCLPFYNKHVTKDTTSADIIIPSNVEPGPYTILYMWSKFAGVYYATCSDIIVH
ncbi:eukaryotic translation initiation factor 4A, putative [Perkinsus marinus ATCC 50983]|uniref:DNA 3'-5' helicase n=1 Tax=Perkinsus marinus (strain ATCC 50983 / TXsc) TaxID=423536 RepID=C5L9Z7_PERM5|nr:eukaryotic translation initiation factor 4A, putative [Perkinsus marinus ATCC 50983]EER06253.1 eukaryotic translation initiation factor 4A, putative [Perkinsus marinus ATCC 50983]|eukprot:XP_002774437.1 eukaryotic translation initiation factor 4A, putative [Perkinsus marinus ATCC 50983]